MGFARIPRAAGILSASGILANPTTFFGGILQEALVVEELGELVIPT